MTFIILILVNLKTYHNLILPFCYEEATFLRTAHDYFCELLHFRKRELFHYPMNVIIYSGQNLN